MLKNKHIIFQIFVICLSVFISCNDQADSNSAQKSIPGELGEDCFPLNVKFKGVYVLPDSSKWIDIDRLAALTAEYFVVDSTGNDQLSREQPEMALRWRGTLSKVDTIIDSSKCYLLTYQNWYLDDTDTCRFLAKVILCADSTKDCRISRGTWDIICPRYNRGGGDIIFKENQ